MWHIKLLLLFFVLFFCALPAFSDINTMLLIDLLEKQRTILIDGLSDVSTISESSNSIDQIMKELKNDLQRWKERAELLETGLTNLRKDLGRRSESIMNLNESLGNSDAVNKILLTAAIIELGVIILLIIF